MKLGLIVPSLFALALPLFGCSSSSGEATGAPPSQPDPGPSPQPVTCAVGSHKTDDGACESTLSITRSPQAVAPGRDHHVTLVAETKNGPYLYVFGGTAGWKVMFNDIQRAKLEKDGSLGAFEKVGTLPEGRAGHCGVYSHGTFTLVGGTIGTAEHPGIANTTVEVKLNDDGSIGEITEGPHLPQGVMHATCDQKSDWLYVAGGRTGADNSSKQMVRAKIGADGKIAPFEALAPLTVDRSHHAAFIRGDYYYIIGGITGHAAGEHTDRKDIMRAKITEDGALGDWESAGDLSRALSVSAAQLFNDRVYVFGGLYAGDSYTDAIQTAGFGADGMIQEFTKTPVKLSVARAHVHQLPVYEKYIYSVGGLDNSDESVGFVDVGTFE